MSQFQINIKQLKPILKMKLKNSSGKKWNHRKYQYHKGIPIPRIYHRMARGKNSARYLVKCGDCDNSFEIYYGPKDDDTLEIGGVLASKKEWRKILLPLLK